MVCRTGSSSGNPCRTPSNMSPKPRSRIGCCGTAPIRATSRACISSWNGSERTLKRRGFLQRGALAAAGLMTGAVRAATRVAARPAVAIVGGGFAGSACALHLRQLNPDIDVRLIDPVEHYATCPMSNEVIAGERGMASITLARGGLRRAGVSVIGDQVIGVDAQQHQLRRHKPRSKVLILDANNSFPKQAQFTDAWNTLYPGMIEWIPVIEDGAVVRVDSATMTLYTAANAHRVAVANVIPPQAPGELAPAPA